MIGNGVGEEAWTVIVDVWIQVIGQETVDEGSMFWGNMSVSQMLADDRSLSYTRRGFARLNVAGGTLSVRSAAC